MGGMIRIVKTSLLGSVLSNTLLVLGMSFLCGGIFSMKHHVPDASSRRASRASQAATPINNSEANPVQTNSAESMDFNMDEKIQSFSLLGALVNTSMLLVSCLAFSLVTVFRMVLVEEGEERRNIMLPVSR